jgi:hypothetical protein
MLCALCLSSRSLVKSHIFPEFLYREVYEKDKQLYFTFSNDPARRAKRRRQGLYERLLCSDCEKRLFQYEDYAAKVIFGGTPIAAIDHADGILVRGIDYPRFKLFQLSLIWRAGMSNLPEIPTRLFGRHPERLRQMLLQGNPGRQYEYGCVLSFLPETFDIMRRTIYPPELLKKRIIGCLCYRAMFAGLFWAYFMSGHMKDFPYPNAFLTETGELKLFKANDFALRFLEQTGAEIYQANRGIIEAVHT